MSTPIASYWTDYAHVNINFGAFAIAMNVLDLAFDLVILALPIPMIRRLQISPKRKISLMGVFGLGFLVVYVCSVVGDRYKHVVWILKTWECRWELIVWITTIWLVLWGYNGPV